MRPSFAIDLAQLQAGVRFVARSQTRAGGADTSELRSWARHEGFFAAIDRKGFFTVSGSAALARTALRIDAWPGNHVVAFGSILDYPLCCCRAAARWGEERIDEWADQVSRRFFVGPFKLIKPETYVEGRGFISHVPCSPRCFPSLKMALALQRGQSPRRKASHLHRRQCHVYIRSMRG
jgi:hypothetical protein